MIQNKGLVGKFVYNNIYNPRTIFENHVYIKVDEKLKLLFKLVLFETLCLAFIKLNPYKMKVRFFMCIYTLLEQRIIYQIANIK